MRAALAEPAPGTLLGCFACIAGESMQRAATIQYALASPAAVDTDAAEMLAITRQQHLTGQSRIVPALVDRGALAESLSAAKAPDIVYTPLSPEV